MRRDIVLVSLLILSLFLGVVVPGSLLAQAGGTLTDIRERNYTDEELGKVLFPEASPYVGTRGIGKPVPQSPAPNPPMPGPAVALNVLFEFNSDKISQNTSRDLDQIGRILTMPAYSTYRVRIEGHTDSVGSDRVNQRLSERRAESVKRYLLQHYSIQPNRLIVKGYGKSQPIATNDTPEGREKNRRVQVANLGVN
jgi:outer membrane protein OmpA-like peptidoglycan-associated protein